MLMSAGLTHAIMVVFELPPRESCILTSHQHHCQLYRLLSLILLMSKSAGLTWAIMVVWELHAAHSASLLEKINVRYIAQS